MRAACKYVGPLVDPSGYGEANRNFVCALNAAGVDVVTEIVSYSNNDTNYFGDAYKLVRELEGRDIPYDIRIVHVPCDGYMKYMEPCKYHIGHLFWETDRMSPLWVWNCNLMDEIWTGSEHNKQAFLKSGVTRPIYIFPEPIDTEMFNKRYNNFKLRGGFNGYLFYSIFQWIQRKNPEALVKAFLEEFSSDENVGLLLKTYREHFTSGEMQDIVAKIWEWKNSAANKNPADIFVHVGLLDKKDVFRIHQTGDCFVLPHRGEGWGIPMVEASGFGKPVIATNYGGVHDWFTKECYLPLTPDLVNVFGMEFAPWYGTEQMWANPSVGELRKKMRWVFENQKEAKEIGARGCSFVHQNFSFEQVGRYMKDRLRDIQKQINIERKKGLKWPK